MRGRTSLRLHHEIMLLALRNREGTVFASMYNFAIGGAILAELLMEKRIDLETIGKQQFPRVLTTVTVGDPLIDECLSRIAAAKKPAPLRDWVSKFAQTKNLKHRVAGDLARRGILAVDEDKVLGIFRRKIYPEIDPVPEQDVIGRLRDAVFGESRHVDPRTVVLLSLVSSADLLGRVFDKKELRGRRARVQQVVNGELTGTATKEAIAAMQAAVMVACVIPAVVASSAVHH